MLTWFILLCSCFFPFCLHSNVIYNLISFCTLDLELETSTTRFCKSHWNSTVSTDWTNTFLLTFLFFAEWTRQQRGKVLALPPLLAPSPFCYLWWMVNVFFTLIFIYLQIYPSTQLLGLLSQIFVLIKSLFNSSFNILLSIDLLNSRPGKKGNK